MDNVYALCDSTRPPAPGELIDSLRVVRAHNGILIPIENIKYVGRTINLTDRHWDHLRPTGKSKNPRVVAWVQEALRNGITVDLVILEKWPTRDEGEEQEFYWINRCLALGAPLLNDMKIDPVVRAAVTSGQYSVYELVLLVAERTAERYGLWSRSGGALWGTSD